MLIEQVHTCCVSVDVICWSYRQMPGAAGFFIIFFFTPKLLLYSQSFVSAFKQPIELITWSSCSLATAALWIRLSAPGFATSAQFIQSRVTSDGSASFLYDVVCIPERSSLYQPTALCLFLLPRHQGETCGFFQGQLSKTSLLFQHDW